MLRERDVEGGVGLGVWFNTYYLRQVRMNSILRIHTDRNPKQKRYAPP